MSVVYGILVVLHLLGWAIVLGGVLVTLRTPALPRGAWHGVLTALLTGLALAAMAFSGLVDRDPDHVKLAVKAVIAVVIAALVWWLQRNPDRVTRGGLGAVLGLTAVNVAIAVLWR